MTFAICTRCRVSQKREGFGKKANGKRLSWCKACNAETSKLYKQTQRGLAQSMLRCQRISSKRRNHPEPDYDLDWLHAWLLKQNNFIGLYSNWEKSGYKKDTIPSVDRLDDSLPYLKDNIQLLSWAENNKKGNTRYLNGDSPKMTVKVDQLTVNGEFIQTFLSVILAAESVGCTSGEIVRVCKGKRNTCRNFKWRYTLVDKKIHK